jgi:hypothetical protein
MANRLLLDFDSGGATLEKARLDSGSFGAALHDAVEIKPTTDIVSDSAPTSTGFEQMIRAVPLRKPHLVWIVVGALCISVALIASAIVATTLYL